MTCRGLDDEGLGQDTSGRIVLGQRRLAVIDLSPRAAQPMHRLHERYVIVFNGEIHNYRALRTVLEEKGRRLSADSDTEVLLQLYAERGSEMVQDLRGMFALAIWDTLKEELFPARDTFGIKPLYYADNGRSLHFASEVKALMRGRNVATGPQPSRTLCRRATPVQSWVAERGGRRPERGLRGWAKRVYSEYRAHA